MIPASVERSVVEILADGVTSLGTGFLVSADGLILTAKHVVGTRATAQIRFREEAPLAATLVESGPGSDDWVLLRAAMVPTQVEPIPLGRIRHVGAEVHWYSVGHANIRGMRRGTFHGVVRAAADRLDLYCEELRDRSYDEARGLSGGPCIVDGEAVGLIIDVFKKNSGQIIAGEVNAIPLERIQPRKFKLEPTSNAQLPWELVFRGLLESLTPSHKAIAARTARLANPEDAKDLALQIARRMINQGICVTAEVLRQLPASVRSTSVIDEVMAVAETLWVNGTAADSLAAIVGGSRIGAIATDFDWSAQHHLWRAYSCRESGPQPWPCVFIDVSHEEPFAEAVVEKAFIELGNAVEAGTDRDTTRRRVAGYPGVTAFVVGTPRKDVIERLQREFPLLVIVFMSRAAVTALALTAGAGIQHVSPAPTVDDETRAQQRNSDAHARLRRGRS